tara:strand:- start:95 stop:277 length:183 start_codon:yes stop_codon:yes gene_type:complete
VKFKLVNKRTDEVVDTVGTRLLEYAIEYFQVKKQLDKETFDNLYEVKVEKENDGNRLTRF